MLGRPEVNLSGQVPGLNFQAEKSLRSFMVLTGSRIVWHLRGARR